MSEEKKMKLHFDQAWVDRVTQNDGNDIAVVGGAGSPPPVPEYPDEHFITDLAIAFRQSAVPMEKFDAAMNLPKGTVEAWMSGENLPIIPARAAFIEHVRAFDFKKGA